MTAIFTLAQIKAAIEKIDVIAVMEQGFIAYSNREVVVPPVGELVFDTPPGDVHIKYGYIKQDDFFVIKIASGFYENPKKYGIPSSNGLNLLFNQKNGEILAILLDEGFLTDVRTAAAGALVAKYLAPKKITAIGVLGTGIQAKMQVKLLQHTRPCKEIYVWGRHADTLQDYRRNMEKDGFTVHPTQNVADITKHCNLIVTCTPSKQPLISADILKPGTHITAVGSDTAEKQELDGQILAKADRIIVDSREQSNTRGEVYKAVAQKLISAQKAIEIGDMIQTPATWRQSEAEITVADLTGVAVQDIQISKAVYHYLHQIN